MPVEEEVDAGVVDSQKAITHLGREEKRNWQDRAWGLQARGPVNVKTKVTP